MWGRRFQPGLGRGRQFSLGPIAVLPGRRGIDPIGANLRDKGLKKL